MSAPVPAPPVPRSRRRRPAPAAPLLHAMTVDVEDYYQVSAFEAVVDRVALGRASSRASSATRARVLALLAEPRRARHVLHPRLGRRPLPRRCCARSATRATRSRRTGTSTGSSGRSRRRRSATTCAARPTRSRRRAACACAGFRAPSFSVGLDTLWAFDVLLDEGYAFSSSVFPVRHDRYGIPSFPRHPVVIRAEDGRTLWEFPMTTRARARAQPARGRGRLDAAPARRRSCGARCARATAAGVPTIVYLHPWEVDPEQPRIADAPRMSRFRHYLNLEKTGGRLLALMDTLRFGTVSEVLATLAPGGRVRREEFATNAQMILSMALVMTLTVSRVPWLSPTLRAFVAAAGMTASVACGGGGFTRGFVGDDRRIRSTPAPRSTRSPASRATTSRSSPPLTPIGAPVAEPAPAPPGRAPPPPPAPVAASTLIEIPDLTASPGTRARPGDPALHGAVAPGAVLRRARLRAPRRDRRRRREGRDRHPHGDPGHARRPADDRAHGPRGGPDALAHGRSRSARASRRPSASPSRRASPRAPITTPANAIRISAAGHAVAERRHLPAHAGRVRRRAPRS